MSDHHPGFPRLPRPKATRPPRAPIPSSTCANVRANRSLLPSSLFSVPRFAPPPFEQHPSNPQGLDVNVNPSHATQCSRPRLVNRRQEHDAAPLYPIPPYHTSLHRCDGPQPHLEARKHPTIGRRVSARNRLAAFSFRHRHHHRRFSLGVVSFPARRSEIPRSRSVPPSPSLSRQRRP